MKAKITAVASILLIGLMFIGVSYALWSKTLVINGVVKTGKLDAEFTSWKWNSTYFDANGVEHPVPDIKKIYTVNIYYGADTEVLLVDIDHLYPCIWIHIYFNITNTGTIPLKFQHYYANASNYVNPLDKFPGDVILTGNLWGTQLEPYPKPIHTVTGDLHIHLNNSALQDQPLGAYRFLVHIEVVQWNEFNPLVGPLPP